jgi:hypothetical protein
VLIRSKPLLPPLNKAKKESSATMKNKIEGYLKKARYTRINTMRAIPKAIATRAFTSRISIFFFI